LSFDSLTTDATACIRRLPVILLSRSYSIRSRKRSGINPIDARLVVIATNDAELIKSDRLFRTRIDGEGMAQKQFSTERIIGMLREAEVRLSQEQTIGAICKGLGISEQSYYR
jgi:hypothetical protein